MPDQFKHFLGSWFLCERNPIIIKHLDINCTMYFVKTLVSIAIAIVAKMVKKIKPSMAVFNNHSFSTTKTPGDPGTHLINLIKERS